MNSATRSSNAQRNEGACRIGARPWRLAAETRAGVFRSSELARASANETRPNGGSGGLGCCVSLLLSRTIIVVCCSYIMAKRPHGGPYTHTHLTYINLPFGLYVCNLHIAYRSIRAAYCCFLRLVVLFCGFAGAGCSFHLNCC